MDDVNQLDTVRCWEEQVVIPTYPALDADRNPMFLEKRVYQGSSGKVYPNPFTDKVSLEKTDRPYRAIFLENQYIHLMILPEIGGRIHAGQDKTNQYDFFYRQNVIKPALVGLLGPWISGGVEFNWPQHHRPSTFMPVHARAEKHDDGSCTVWLSEHDPMLRMKGMVGICLSPGKSLVEAKVRLYNRTPLAQTFLWWANVAVRVHDQYQAFFPPDVSFVADHAKRAISSFPIARNSYYGVDYWPGTDISWYKNIPVPTSYMVSESKFDFFGGYDHARQAGLVHTSNHRVAPGKKLWTWGNAEFGYAWDRNLTDDDGPYVELMAGAFTDNQPDFSWLQPYETKTVSQYWYPIQKIGPAKNANREVALNLEFEAEAAQVRVASTSKRSIRVVLTCDGKPVLDEVVTIAPDSPLLRTVGTKSAAAEKHILRVEDMESNEILSYQPMERADPELPRPATEPASPAEMESIDELFLTGLHLEQYRHATRSPQDYWLEGLKRDPEDARLNNAMGLVHFRRGEFAAAEEHFLRATRRLTKRNPNPQDGEPFYNLGLARLYQGKEAEAYDAFHKCIWNYAWQSAGNYALASISVNRGEWTLALEQVEQSLLTNTQSLNARGLKASILRKLGRTAEAQAVVEVTLKIDSLDFRAMAECFLLSRGKESLCTFIHFLQQDWQSLLDVTFDLAQEGLHEDAFLLLQSCIEETQWDFPMLWYTLSWLAQRLQKQSEAAEFLVKAEAASPRYCFPARLEEMVVLQDAIKRNPFAAKAHSYLGNLYHDKRRYDDAVRAWRHSIELDDTFSVPLRNLGIAEFNVLHDAETSSRMYERAFRADPSDARVLYEWDQLKKRAGLASPDERLHSLQHHGALVAERDDLSVELITLLNQAGQYSEALTQIGRRRFSPWEGGEGLVSTQYVHAHRALGRMALGEGAFREALDHFDLARRYPESLGEGKHLLTLERDLDYFSGLAAQGLGDANTAQRFWKAAAAPLADPGIHSYFQALALRSLNQPEAGHVVLKELEHYAIELLKTEAKIDYFATSLPNLLLFEDDLEKRNRIEANVLIALAKEGLGDRAVAIDLLREVLAEDTNHLFASETVYWLTRQEAPVSSNTEARPLS
jgi:tetratricopeptide (TPR) repeat protein